MVARVVVDVRPIAAPLDYLVPDELSSAIGIGSLVRVPLQGRRVRGWVVALGEDAEVPEDELKPIRSLVADVPVASWRTIDLATWAATDAAGPTATVLSWATPAPLPRRIPPQASPAATSERMPVVPGVTEAVRESRHVEAFVRTWPSDDGAATCAAVSAALPEGRTLLVVAPPGRAPALSGAVDLTRVSGAAHTNAWERAAAGSAAVVVTGRHGPFVPVPSLGAVVVTAAHSEVHKDERTPTIDARRTARRLASDAGVPFVLLSPTQPLGTEGLESDVGRSLSEAARTISVPGAQGRWPHVEIASLLDEPPGGGALGSRFFRAVRAARQSGGRTLVFLNRTGTARTLVCKACGSTATCERCSGVMRPETAPDRLVCVRCAAELPFMACPSCGSSAIRRVGIGVDRLRSELADAFAGVEVLVASGTDSPVPGPGGIVAGTQVALRHRGTFDLVVLVDPDAALGRPGLLSADAEFATLVDAVAAAKGRADGGRVLVQTRQPSHPAIDALARCDCSIWEQASRSRRRDDRLPPWRRLLRVSTADADVAHWMAQALSAAGAEVLGPVGDDTVALLAFVEPRRWGDAVGAARAVAADNTHVRIRIEADPLDPR